MIQFTIPGPPTGKGRPRATASGGYARMYTPTKTVSYEEKVVAFYLESNGHVPMIEKDVPVYADIIAFFKMPKSWSKTKLNKMVGTPCLKAPDFDNIGKIICDALNGVAYHDDKQVYQAHISKYWSTTDRVEVEILADGE